MRIFTLLIVLFFLTGCSSLKNLIEESTTYNADVIARSHPLKTKQDIRTEKLITGGRWKYQRQEDDCKDTEWSQIFHKNRYYQSGGSACLLKDAFSVDAENWHVKKTTLYITNLSPVDDDDIILKYGIHHLSKGKMILSSNGYKYTFLKHPK